MAWILEASRGMSQSDAGGVTSHHLAVSPPLLALADNYRSEFITPDEFFFLKKLSDGESFRLNGFEAYSFMTMLYCHLAKLIRPGGRWIFTTELRYEVIFRSHNRQLVIDGPRAARGLLIGRDGANIQTIERALSPIVSWVQVL